MADAVTAARLRFTILGGGTAGWMAACLIAHRWPQHHVTVIESPDIGIIGVGEGSTPQLKAFFDTLGIAERDWMPACNATYKTGISFHGWSERPGFDRYFHPFQSDLDGHTAPHFFFNTRARRTGRDVWAHPDRFFVPARLAAEKRVPIAPDNFPFNIGYGYHFDATLVGQFLRNLAVSKLNVTHLPRTVKHVDIANDNVTGLILEDGETVPGDIFVDASGFRGTIIQQALGEPFRPFAQNLFNDSAIAVPTPHTDDAIACETRATALSAGWVWHIPLTNRVGNGYVYASAFKDKDAAETELRAHLGLLDSDVAVRHLSMNVGRVERSWVGNCLAVGLSQGFIEPLEATALHIVQATVEGFMDAFDTGGFTAAQAPHFNARIAARYEGIRDYIVAHYRMNQRQDSDYWRTNAANQNLSDSLKGIMTAWFTGADLVEEINQQDIAHFYAPLSWHCLLGGYGTYPDAAKLKAPEPDLPIADLARIDRFVSGCAANFPTHADALAALG